MAFVGTTLGVLETRSTSSFRGSDPGHFPGIRIPENSEDRAESLLKFFSASHRSAGLVEDTSISISPKSIGGAENSLIFPLAETLSLISEVPNAARSKLPAYRLRFEVSQICRSASREQIPSTTRPSQEKPAGRTPTIRRSRSVENRRTQPTRYFFYPAWPMTKVMKSSARGLPAGSS
jgi:hypothetical protein